VANGHYLAALRGVESLFGPDAVAGLSDSTLVERIADGTGKAVSLAFAAIIDRHGPMVLRVCKAVLHDRNDAEDAFQATFLILLHKAGSIRDPGSTASWLHGVAYRVAISSRKAAIRRRRHERRAADRSESTATELAFDDSATILHEELNRLPARYLAPIVLCHLEGQSHEQAASQLDWPVGTVRSRLARGRDRLRDRLIRRGLAPSVIVGISVERAAASVAESTVRMATGIVPSPASALVGDLVRTSIMLKLKFTAAIALATGVFVTGAVVAQSGRESRKAEAPVASPAPREVDLDVLRRLTEQKIDLHFPNPTPLEAILKYAKAASKGPKDTGLAIYVDPVGLQQAGAKIDSLVTLELKDVSIKAALTSTLKPLNLAFVVKDGLVMIGSRDDVLETRLDRVEQKLDQILKALDDLKHEPRR
jgi:RNA polymerase sigma factor (sigma-70 family)